MSAETFYQKTISELSRKLYPSQQQTDQVIRSAKYMDTHFADGLSLYHISGSAYYSRFHFIRLFKKYYGVTPMQYLTNIRIAEAKKLLGAGHSVTDTCFQLGFESIPSFTALFKKATGKAPSAFKKSNIQ